MKSGPKSTNPSRSRQYIHSCSSSSDGHAEVWVDKEDGVIKIIGAPVAQCSVKDSALEVEWCDQSLALWEELQGSTELKEMIDAANIKLKKGKGGGKGKAKGKKGTAQYNGQCTVSTDMSPLARQSSRRPVSNTESVVGPTQGNVRTNSTNTFIRFSCLTASS